MIQNSLLQLYHVFFVLRVVSNNKIKTGKYYATKKQKTGHLMPPINPEFIIIIIFDFVTYLVKVKKAETSDEAIGVYLTL